MSAKTQALLQALVVELVKTFFTKYESNLSKDEKQMSMYINNRTREFGYRESDEVESPTITVSIPVAVLFETSMTENIFKDTAVFEVSVSEDGLFIAGLYMIKGSDEALEIAKDTFTAGGVDIVHILQTCKAVYHGQL